MHHLVVGNRIDEALGVLVHHRERQLVDVESAMDRLLREELERVVHPAHVPLEREAEPAVLDVARYSAPRRTLFGDGKGPGGLLSDRRVRAAQELDGLDVLPTSVLVGHPFAMFPAVVEVEHRSDCIDPERIHMELLDPEQRVGDQESLHLAAPEVENEGTPVGVFATARIVVLVQRCPVEPPQGPVVFGEVRGNPIDDHADAVLMAVVDEVTEIVGRSIA